jgi:hypothetical protein
VAVQGASNSTGEIEMPTKPRDNSDDDAPKTYFEWELRKVSKPEDKGEIYINKYPPLPRSNPWARDPVPDEPLIDRSGEDGDTKDMTQE